MEAFTATYQTDYALFARRKNGKEIRVHGEEKEEQEGRSSDGDPPNSRTSCYACFKLETCDASAEVGRQNCCLGVGSTTGSDGWAPPSLPPRHALAFSLSVEG